MNPVPPIVVALVVVIGLVEAALSLGGAGLAGGPAAIGWRLGLIERFAVSPAVLDYVLAGRWNPSLLVRFVAYPFAHGSVMHALFAVALLLALGKFVGEGMGQGATLAVFAAGTVGGALGFGLLLDGAQPLYGAYPGIYGLIGAFTYLTWLRLGQMGENRLMAFRMIGMLMGVQLLFGALFGSNPQWVGDVAGFVAGGIAAVAVSPAVLDYVLAGRWDLALLLRFVAYPFVHGSVMHALFARALLLALGKFVGEGMGQGATLAVFVAGTVGGALGFGLLVGGETQPLYGAYPGIYGLIGAFTYLTWLRLGAMGENRLMAFRMIGMLLAIQLVFGALFGTSPQWVGDVAGFVAGGLAAVVVAPGGLAALRGRLRAR